jgi:hypothetical protein
VVICTRDCKIDFSMMISSLNSVAATLYNTLSYTP